jgi:hypothetical protein
LNRTSRVSSASAISVGSKNDHAMRHPLPDRPEKIPVSTFVPSTLRV